jgi:hypothetical protein
MVLNFSLSIKSGNLAVLAASAARKPTVEFAALLLMLKKLKQRKIKVQLDAKALKIFN